MRISNFARAEGRNGHISILRINPLILSGITRILFCVSILLSPVSRTAFAAPREIRGPDDFAPLIEPLKRGAEIAGGWRLANIEAGADNSIVLACARSGGLRKVTVTIWNRQPGARAFSQTKSFQLSYSSRSKSGQETSEDISVLMDAVTTALEKNDPGGLKIKVSLMNYQGRASGAEKPEPPKINTVSGSAAGNADLPLLDLQPSGVLFLMLIAGAAVAALLVFLLPEPKKNAALFLAIAAAALAMRFFAVPDLLAEYHSEDYQIFISALPTQMQTAAMGHKSTNIHNLNEVVKKKPAFLFKLYLDLVGRRFDNLFPLFRFLSALLVMLTFIVGMRLGGRATALFAALGVLLCPGQIMCGAAVSRHLPAAALLLLSLCLMLAASGLPARSAVPIKAAAFLLLCAASLQKLDFAWFPFMYFIAGRVCGEKDVGARGIAVSLAKSALTVTFLVLVDSALGLNWLHQVHDVPDLIGGNIGNPVLAYNPALFVMSPPSPVFDALCVAALLNRGVRAPAKWLAVIAIAAFLYLYTLSAALGFNKTILRFTVISPFIYLAAGELLGRWTNGRSLRAAVVIVLLCFAPNLLYASFVRRSAVNSPKTVEYRILRNSHESMRGCKILYTTLPMAHSPVFTLAALAPEANFEPLEFAKILRPGSRAAAEMLWGEYCIRNHYHHAIRKMSGAPFKFDYFLSYLHYKPLHEDFPMAECKSRLGARFAGEHPEAAGASGSGGAETQFTAEFREALSRGECVLFLKDAGGVFGEHIVFRWDYNNRIALSMLKTTPIARSGEAALLRVTGLSGGRLFIGAPASE